MAVTITAAGLRAAYPEWTNAPDDVVSHAVSTANARPLGLYVDRAISTEAEETHRRYLEASSYLFRHPFSRDMIRTQTPTNPYFEELQYLDKLKGALYRAPGWPDPGISES